MKHEVHLPQGTIRYREDGTGEPLLFVHGVVVNGDLWRKVVPRLAKDFRCIVPDWPLGSHELPMSPDADLSPPGLAQLVVDFMDALGLETVTLVGNDTGGALCQIVAAEHPERVARLVLTSCDLYDRFPPPVFKPLAKVVKVPGAVWLIGQSLRPRFAQRLPIAFGWVTKRHPGAGRHRLLPAPRSLVARRPARPGEGFRLGRRALHDRGRGEARELRQAGPARVGGRRTSCSRSSTRSGLPTAVPDGTLEEIADSYTFIAEDQPERLAEAIATFVRRPAAVSA